MDEQDERTEGFDAISQKLQALYPGQNGRHYGTILSYRLGGNDPLDGVEVWESEKGCPHWHYVTYGFTELYEKESEDPKVSGYGFELTFRLKRGGEETPPAWPINLLQNLARYVFSSGNAFGDGHYIDCNGPIALETGTRLTALGFRTDPELGEMDTPNGHMAFLQAVGVTEDEKDALMCWSGTKFLELMSKGNPLCVTDLERPSLMESPAFKEAWKQGVLRDGSSTSVLYMDEVKAVMQDGKGRLQLGAGHTDTLALVLRGRVGKRQHLYIQSQDGVACLKPGEQSSLASEDGCLAITLTAEALEELCSVLQPHAGEYPLHLLPLTVKLVPTHIKDKDGNILQTIE